MIIKKFQGKTEEEAITTAKSELGESVVVMNVKNVKPKGFFHFLKSSVVEVTVAKEEESEKSSLAKTGLVNPINTLTKSAEETAKRPQFSLFTPDILARTEGVYKKEEEVPEKGIEEKLNSLQSLLEQQLKRTEEESGEKEQKEEEPSENVVFMQLLYNTMLDNEVAEVYANQIIDEIDKGTKTDIPMDYMLANVYQKMILKFGKPEGITPGQKSPKVIFFLGPTGVGKTTTIAKIASKFSVDEKKKVALITADTYRIAAAEQLRTYAGILDVPFRVIYMKEELNAAVEELRDCDYILVDTAGHSYKNETQKESMSYLIHSLPEEIEREVFLVLSATTKYRDLINTADAYSEIADYKLIFTKVDETTTLGNLFNVRMHTGASLSYITYGQNVPDDIQNFNPQHTVKQLLGGRK